MSNDATLTINFALEKAAPFIKCALTCIVAYFKVN